MEVFAGLSVLLLFLVAASIAVKTFAMWRRTAGNPELLLGLYLTSATVVGYPLAIAMSQIPASENWVVHVAAQVVMGFGWSMLFVFTLIVFRPDAAWARVFAVLLIVGVSTSIVAYTIEVMGERPRTHQEMPVFMAILVIPAALGYGWTSVEGILYHVRLKRRLRLGLSDSVVVNRVLLWGLMASGAGAALLLNVIALLVGLHMTPPVILMSSLFGLVHAGCLYLAFHPPSWYTDWLERRARLEVV